MIELPSSGERFRGDIYCFGAFPFLGHILSSNRILWEFWGLREQPSRAFRQCICGSLQNTSEFYSCLSSFYQASTFTSLKHLIQTSCSQLLDKALGCRASRISPVRVPGSHKCLSVIFSHLRHMNRFHPSRQGSIDSDLTFDRESHCDKSVKLSHLVIGFNAPSVNIFLMQSFYYNWRPIVEVSAPQDPYWERSTKSVARIKGNFGLYYDLHQSQHCDFGGIYYAHSLTSVSEIIKQIEHKRYHSSISEIGPSCR